MFITPCILAALIASTSATGFFSDSSIKVAPELGITPESLVVAGFQPTDAVVMFQRIDGAANDRQSLAAAHTSLDQAIAALSSVREASRRNPTNDDLRSQLQAARQAVATARQNLQQAQDALQATALEGFASFMVDELNEFHAATVYKVVPAFRADARAHDEWTMIEIALRMEKRAIRTGDELPDEIEQMLNAIRSDPDVILAQTRLDTGLAVMQQVFDTERPPD